MKLVKLFTLAGIAVFSASPVIAQTVGIGTTAKGATSQVSAAIAKVTSQFGGMQMRPTPMAGTQKYMPAVNNGSLEFGVANIMQTAWSIKGQVLSEGRPNPNILLVSTLMKFRVGPLVGKKTNFKSVGDLKGSRAPTGFKGAPLFNEIIKTALATGNLTIGDTKNIPIAALVPSWKALMAGKIDFAIGAYGSGFMKLIAKNSVVFVSFQWICLLPHKLK